MRLQRPKSAPRVLLVEGGDEQYALPELLELNGIAWPSKAPPVHIVDSVGIESLLARENITTELKAPGLEALGLIVDANGDAGARWNRVRGLLTSIRAGFPQ